MANVGRNTMLLVSIACLSLSMCGIATAGSKTVKLPWDAKPIPQQSPLLKQSSIDPETLKELVEFQEIVTEGVPLLLKLFNKLMKNKFAKPLFEVLLTCDKQNFMVSCVQGIFQKVISIFAGQNHAQPSRGDGDKKSHDHLQPHSEMNRAQPRKSDEGEIKNMPGSDETDNHSDTQQQKSYKNQRTGDDIKIKEHRPSQQSGEGVQENQTQNTNAKLKRPHTPLGPTSANHKSEL